ncbi:MAG: FAD-dependent oxidoreductase, partial [Smithella sp.]|nr:FAD-dependent oxidoreductase [Smithella sp.]
MAGYDTEYDVIVCGGGTSGVAAAISAARTGAKTLVIERTGCLGGQMCVSGPPGFAYARLFNTYGEQDTAGFVEETHARLYKAGHAWPHYHPKHRVPAAYTFSYVDPEWWMLMIFNMMEEEGVDLLIDSLVVGAVKDNDTVKGVLVENADGRREIKGKIVIDCTGEAYFANYAGAETVCVDVEDIQPHTISFTADGVDWDKLLTYINRNPEQFEYQQLLHRASDQTKEDVYKAYSKVVDIRELGEVMGFKDLRDAALKNGDWHPFSGAGFFLQPKEGGKILAHFQHSSHWDKTLPTDAWALSRCHIECRKQIQIAWRFFKNYVPGFENAYIVKISTELRLREGPRIVGDYVLNRDDVINTRQFSDTIGKSSFPAGAYHTANVNT